MLGCDTTHQVDVRVYDQKQRIGVLSSTRLQTWSRTGGALTNSFAGEMA